MRHWSSTQAVVALSSAEAELNGIIKAASECFGIRHLFNGCGDQVEMVIHIDSPFANGILHRRGCGNVKHLQVRQLWLQHFVANGVVEVKKVPRDANWTDALTHHWKASEEWRHFESMGMDVHV